MEAATLLGVAAAVSVIGAGVSAYGMYQQGQAQKKMADYNAQVQSNNAVMKMQQANYEATLQRQRNNRLRGMQAAAASRSGLDLSGSVEDVMNDSAIQGELNAQQMLYKGEVGSEELSSASNLSRLEGQQAVTNSYFGSAGSILGGLGTAAGDLGRIRPSNYDYPNLD